ncbi:MAG: FAD-dependent oxidoreductase [Candidatus Micrarchaeota archaeon]
MKKQARTGILGGGLTGLTLGSFLGKNSEILEAGKEAGGLCRSMVESGFTFDYGGSHVIFSKDKEALQFILNALGKNLVKRRRNTKILFKGRYVKYPFENGLSDLPKKDNLDCLRGFIKAYEKGGKGKPRNFKEWVYSTFGEGIAKRYMIPYNEKVWKTKASKLGVDWVYGRVPQPPLEDVVKSSKGIATEGYTHQLHFYYPKIGGIQTLTESLEKKCGRRITKNFEVKKVKKEGNVWVVSNGEEERVFERIVSTIPIFDLVKATKAPKEIRGAAKKLRYSSIVTVMIGVDRKKLNDLSWLYIPERGVKANRVSFPSNYSPYCAPKGKSTVLAEITCLEGDKVWRMNEEKIAQETIEDLARLGIIKEKDVSYCSVRRAKYAYVVCDIDYSRNTKIIRDYFEELGITLCGRFSEYKYLNMDGCVRSAMTVASGIA